MMYVSLTPMFFFHLKSVYNISQIRCYIGYLSTSRTQTTSQEFPRNNPNKGSVIVSSTIGQIKGLPGRLLREARNGLHGAVVLPDWTGMQWTMIRGDVHREGRTAIWDQYGRYGGAGCRAPFGKTKGYNAGLIPSAGLTYMALLGWLN